MIKPLLRPYMVVFFVLLASFCFGEIQNSLLQGLRTGNAKEIASLFSPNISITIKNETGYYSKFQAEMVLHDFFRVNRSTDVKQMQRVSNNTTNYYIIYQLKTSSDTYRVFVRFVDNSGSHQISELRIE